MTASPVDKSRPLVFALFLAVIVLSTLLVDGCSSGSSGQTTSTSVAPSTSTAPASTSSTLPSLLSDREKELAKTARTQNELAGILKQQNVPLDDPRMALVYSLRARAQALGCLSMLAKGDAASLETADGVMLDIYHMLNLARGTATGTTAETLAAARAIADKIGAPSNHVDEAADLLEQFIQATAPLIDQAAAIIKAGTSS